MTRRQFFPTQSIVLTLWTDGGLFTCDKTGRCIVLPGNRFLATMHSGKLVLSLSQATRFA